MKARHLNIDDDLLLYKDISQEISNKLVIDKKKEKQYFLWKALFYIGLGVISYTLLYYFTDPFLFVLSYMLFGFVAVLLCFNFAHDLSHHAIFRNPYWDNLFFEFIYTLVGAHPEAWKKRHLNSHHFAPNVENYDTDLSITNLIRVLPTSELKWYHKFQHIYASLAYMTYSIYWFSLKDFIVLNKFAPKRLKQRVRYYFKFILVKSVYITYLIILPMSFSQQPIWIVIVAFIAMHFFQSLYTLYTFFITHHVSGSNYPTAKKNGTIQTSWFMNQVKSSNDFHPFSHVANFIFGGVNCHIAHHLFPHINHYYYPQLNKILYEKLNKNDIVPSQTTFLGGIYSHLKLLRARGKATLH